MANVLIARMSTQALSHNVFAATADCGAAALSLREYGSGRLDVVGRRLGAFGMNPPHSFRCTMSIHLRLRGVKVGNQSGRPRTAGINP